MPSYDSPNILPNDIELAILRHIARTHPMITNALSNVLPTLSVIQREYTGVGSYTNFALGPRSSDFTRRTYSFQNQTIKLPQLQYGLDAILFCKDHRPDFLELVTFGDEQWDGRHDGFSIE